MDGHFVPNLTFGPKMVADLRTATRLPLDVHLMIERPEEWIGRYVEAGATYVTVHVEASRDPAGTLDAIRKAGAHPGIALNPETDVARVLPHIGRADLVLVMSVHPGFGGQTFSAGRSVGARRGVGGLPRSGWGERRAREVPARGRLVGVPTPELPKTLIADAEVMRDLVHHRVANDLRLAPRRRRHPLDRTAVDGDAVGHVRLAVRALGEGDPFIEAQELATVGDPVRLWLVVDDDLDVPHPIAERRREVHQRSAHEPGESRPLEV